MNYLFFRRFFRNKLVVVGLCVILGLIVAYGETKYIRSTFAEVEYVPVLVAKEDIKINMPLVNAELKNLPKNLVTEEMILNKDFINNRVSTREIKKGTIIFKGDTSIKKIPVLGEGMVRVTFETNLSDGLGGKIYPGDIVNIGYVEKDTGNSIKLFENICIEYITDREGNGLNTAIGGEKKNEYDTKSIPATVTVIMNEEDAVKLKGYESLGKLFLMGR